MGIIKKTISDSPRTGSDVPQSLSSSGSTRRMKFTFSIAIFALALTGCTSNASSEQQSDEGPTEKIVSVAPNCESALQRFSLHDSEENPGSAAWYVSEAEATLTACRSADWIAWVDANRSIHSTFEDYLYYSDTAPIMADGNPERFLEELCANYLEDNGTSALACS